MLGVPGITETVATGTGLTVSAAFPVTPLAVATMSVVPAPTPVAMPSLVTVAVAGVAEDQMTVATTILAPFWSRPLAVAVAVFPIWIVAGVSVTLMVVS